MDLCIPTEFYNPFGRLSLSSSDEKVFSKFRQAPELAIYLEYDVPILTERYAAELKRLLNKYPLSLNILESLDVIGSPVVQKYENLGGAVLSQPVIRYWLWALTILDMGLIGSNILEIGGGFGGQAAAMEILAQHGHFKLDSYRIMDLPDVCPLINKYVKTLNGLNTKIVAKELDRSIGEVKGVTDSLYDLVIANYSVAEFTPDVRALYLDFFKNCKHAFIVWNSTQKIPNVISSRLKFDLIECGAMREDIRVIGW